MGRFAYQIQDMFRCNLEEFFSRRWRSHTRIEIVAFEFFDAVTALLGEVIEGMMLCVLHSADCVAESVPFLCHI